MTYIMHVSHVFSQDQTLAYIDFEKLEDTISPADVACYRVLFTFTWLGSAGMGVNRVLS